MSENLSREAAESVTEEIRASGKALTTARGKFASAVKRARSGNAHTVLGFKSWTEYVAHTFSDLPGIGVMDREYLVAFMAGEGMSSRAMSRVLGISQSSAARMIRQAEEDGKVETGRKVTGTDGKNRPAKSAKSRKSTKSKSTKSNKVKTDAPNKVTVRTATTEGLKSLTVEILAELSRRATEDDAAAQQALMDIAESVDMRVAALV